MLSMFDRFVNVPGGQVFTKAWVQKQNSMPPIILLHDSLGCVDLWGHFPVALAEATKRSVIAYDRLGFGHSSARKGLPTIEFISEEAEIYFRAIKSELEIEDFSLFGHSVGGGMAVAIATQFKNECRSIITESAQAFVEDLTVKGIQIAKEKFKNPKAIEKLKKLHGEKALWVLSAWIDVWLSPEFADWSLKESLPEVKCPVLAIHGEKDEYGSRKFPEMISSLAGGKSHMELIADCGHIPHREKKELVLEIVSSFLG